MREGHWKLLVNEDSSRIELYNVAKDGSESSELSKQHPECVKHLAAQLETWKKSLPEEVPSDCISRKRR